MTRIHVRYGAARAKPLTGDRKLVHSVDHVRVQSRVTFGPHRGALIVSGGRPVYEWVPVADAPAYVVAINGRRIGKNQAPA